MSLTAKVVPQPIANSSSRGQPDYPAERPNLIPISGHRSSPNPVAMETRSDNRWEVTWLQDLRFHTFHSSCDTRCRAPEKLLPLWTRRSTSLRSDICTECHAFQQTDFSVHGCTISYRQLLKTTHVVWTNKLLLEEECCCYCPRAFLHEQKHPQTWQLWGVRRYRYNEKSQYFLSRYRLYSPKPCINI